MTDKDVAGKHYDTISENIDRYGVMVHWVSAGVGTPALPTRWAWPSSTTLSSSSSG